MAEDFPASVRTNEEYANFNATTEIQLTQSQTGSRHLESQIRCHHI